MESLKVSVTALARFVSRTGNLSGAGSFGSVSGMEGTRLHKRVFADLKKQYGDGFTTEHKLSHTYIYERDDGRISLEIGGRADILFEQDKDGMPHIIEIKSFNSGKTEYERLVHTDHEAQLKIYAALYFLDMPDLEKMNITLRYVNITTLNAVEKTECIKRSDALIIYEDHALSYIDFVKKLLSYDDNLYRSIREMKFPYPYLRNGQKELMKTVLQSLSNDEVLFALAPTGTGKTISVLYPAVKGLLRNKYDKIFYLTAKTQTRAVAAKALNDMRRSGLVLRSVTLQSKEQMCLLKRSKCDTKGCIYAEGYYNRLVPALTELLTHDELTPELITRTAMRYRICPHELSLDAMNYCTVVIGDYNHAFDPRVSLIRSFGDDEIASRNALLIDEAHNMVDRSRTMFSASLSKSLINRMQEAFKGRDPRTEGFLAQADHYFSRIRELLISGQSAMCTLEKISEKDTLRTADFEGSVKRILNLYTVLWRSVCTLQQFLDSLEAGPVRDTVLEYFFETRFFLTIFEQVYDQNFITTFDLNEGDVTVSLVCLDASEKIRSRIENICPAVFFSATLSPYEYYRNVIVGKNCECSRHIELASPFPPENLEIMIDTSINTSYKHRKETLPALSKRIYKELKDRHGNYMVFLPSFEYLDMTADSAADLLKERADLKIIRQRPNMTAIEKEDFLASFEEAYNGLLVGFAVLGGHFGEGIDLTGEKLSGVIIVGVGLPKLTPERQILANYYSEKFGDGFAFAYRFPGWEKVLQAVGRVIRTEEDTGFALLIDERLDSPEYISLFPDNWRL